MSKYNLSDLIAKANNNTCAVTGTGNSKLSVSIVNNINGKRITISKSLSESLSLSTSAYFLPVEETSQLLISAAPIGEQSTPVALSDKGKKICYNSKFVQKLSACFKLDFTDKTSMSFTEIEINTSTEHSVAVVNITPTTSDTIEGTDSQDI